MVNVVARNWPDFEISWAGSSRPWRPGFCLGSEDGRIRFVDEDGGFGPPMALTTTGEAVNGVAFSGDVVAVSTRDEVVFRRYDSEDGDEYDKWIYQRGAHGIITTPAGRFVAPAGKRGLLVTGPDALDRKTTKTINPSGESSYIYKVTSLVSSPEAELLVCAMRTEGMAIAYVPESEAGFVRRVKGSSLDIVDVCRAESGTGAVGVIALGMDRAMYVVKDSGPTSSIPTLRVNGLQGTPYRVLSCDGHLFLLTSNWLLALPKVVDRLIEKAPWKGPTLVRGIPLEAVDAEIVDGHLLVVMTDQILMMKAADFAGGESETTHENFPVSFEPTWEFGQAVPLESSAVPL